MQQVELITFHDIDHFARECRFVGFMLEQRILQHTHFMKKDVLREVIEPDWLTVADEMHFMPALCQAFSQFGGYYTAAAKGGITNDTNIHKMVTSIRQEWLVQETLLRDFQSSTPCRPSIPAQSSKPGIG